MKGIEEVKTVPDTGAQEDQALGTSSRLETFSEEHGGLETAVTVHSRLQFCEGTALTESAVNSEPKDGFSTREVVNAHESESYDDSESMPSTNEEKKQIILPQGEEQVPEVEMVEEQVAEAPAMVGNAYVKRTFSRVYREETESGDDGKLREYWTHLLQTNASSGEIVEEIVKVLKNHQNTHDLMCPTCGSCITRTVILRKRKRSSLISVERWYSETLAQESERRPNYTEESRSLKYSGEDTELEAQRIEQLTEAYGCLTCFSIFLQKGCEILTERETFECFPFLCPSYTWGSSDPESKSSGIARELCMEKVSGEISAQNFAGSYYDTTLESVEQAGAMQSSDSKGTECISVLVPALLPTYPWGPSQISAGVSRELSMENVTGEISTQNIEVSYDDTTLETVEESRGIQSSESKGTESIGVLAPALLPTYSWGPSQISAGVSRELSMENVTSEISNQNIAVLYDDTTLETVDEARDFQSSESKGTECISVLAPALLPTYPWGSPQISAGVSRELSMENVTGEICVQNIAVLYDDTTLGTVEEARDIQSSESKGTECISVLAPALLPTYPWGPPQISAGVSRELSMENVTSEISIQNVAVLYDDTTLETVEEARDIQSSESKGTECIGVLAPALLPTYPWGPPQISAGVSRELSMENVTSEISTQNIEVSYDDTTLETVEEARDIQSFESKGTESVGVLAPALLPTYSWGPSQISAGVSRELSMGNVTGKISTQNIGVSYDDTTLETVEEARDIQSSESKGTEYVGVLAPVWLPTYPWGSPQISTGIARELWVKSMSGEISTQNIAGSFHGTTSESVDQAGDILSSVSKDKEFIGVLAPAQAQALLPTYSWRPSQISAGIARELCMESLTDEISTENTTLENVEPAVEGQSSQSKGTGCIDVLAPALLPTFPWGPSQIAAGIARELCMEKVIDEFSAQSIADEFSAQSIAGPYYDTTLESVEQAENVQSSPAKGTECIGVLALALLPTYPWGPSQISAGTTRELLVEKVAIGEISTQNIAGSYHDPTIESIEQARDIQSSESKGAECIRVLAPALLPTYPRGPSQISAGIARELCMEIVSAEISAQNIAEPYHDPTIESVEQAVEIQSSGSKGAECVDVFGAVLLPVYPWGSSRISAGLARELCMEKVSEEISTQNIAGPYYDTTLESVELAGDIQSSKTKGTECIGVLVPALLPTYPWAPSQNSAGPDDHSPLELHRSYEVPRSFDNADANDSPHNADEIITIGGKPANVDPQSVDYENENSNRTCGLGSIVLPEFSWGVISEDKVTPPNLAIENVHGGEEVGGLPDLFPDYPWGSSPNSEGSTDHFSFENKYCSDKVHSSSGDAESDDCTGGLCAVLLPEYSWKTVSKVEKYSSDKVHSSSGDAESDDCTGGLCAVLLPEYPWNTVSKETVTVEKVSPETSTQGTVEVCGTTTQNADKKAESLENSPEGAGLTSGVVPAFLHGNPLGSSPLPSGDVKTRGCHSHERSVSIKDITADVPESSVYGGEIQAGENFQSSTCELFPDYSWGTFSEVGGQQVCEAWRKLNLITVSQNPESDTHEAKDADFTCGLCPIFSKYPWALNFRTDDQQEKTRPEQVKSHIKQEGWIETYETSDLISRVSSKDGQTNETTDVISRISSKDGQTNETTDVISRVSSKDGQTNETTDVLSMVSSKDGQTNETTDVLSMVSSKDGQTNETTDVLSMVSSKDGEHSRQTSSWEENAHVKGLTTSFNAAVDNDESLVGKVGEQSLTMSLDFREKGPLNSGFYDVEELDGENISDIETLIILEEQQERRETLRIAKPSVSQDPSTAAAWLLSVAPSDLMTLCDAEELHGENNSQDTRELETYLILEEQQETVLVAKSSGVQDPRTAATCILPVPPWDVVESQGGDSRNQINHIESSSFDWSAENGDADTLMPSVHEEVPYGFKMPRFSDLTVPLLRTQGKIDEGIEVKVVSDSAVLPNGTSREAKFWEILKPIVYGGLDVSIASLGVISGAAGANAITRTVVYMGLAALLSGFIVFYHNVLNLYHMHRDHYGDVVGSTIALHGTIALISFIVFGALPPLVYAFSHRQTDDGDQKFILCCGATIVVVSLLSLGKARVSNRRYLRTLGAYLSALVLSSIVGYLTGDHVAELLDSWGI